jgi:hypothetical protein
LNVSQRPPNSTADSDLDFDSLVTGIRLVCNIRLRLEDIGVRLTEGMMMDPEASVSALVFHHPDCPYFTASEETEAVMV